MRETGGLPPGHFGFVRFDFVEFPREGWLARHGTPARRFSSPAEIPIDGTFWTNLEWEHMHRGSAVGRLGQLRHAAYLPVRPSDALRELGFDEGLLGPDETTRLCACLFGRVMSWASRLLAAGLPGMPPERHFVRGSLREDLVGLMADLEFPRGDEAHILREGQSYQTVSATLTTPRREAVRMLLRRPRLRHALNLLSSPSPSGPWRFLPGEALEPLERLLASGRPSLCRVRLARVQEACGELYGFGNTLDRGRRGLRGWAAQPELDALRRMADVDVEAAWLGGDYRPLGARLPVAVDELVAGRFLRLSWSIGVCLEALWRAALVPPPRRGGSRDRRGDISWQGLWARAADKLLLYPLVRALAERGHGVSCYAFGWIHCLVEPGREEEFLRDAASLGLVPRLADLPRPLALDRWGGLKAEAQWAGLVYGGRTERLFALDAIAEASPDRHEDLLGDLRCQEMAA